MRLLQTRHFRVVALLLVIAAIICQAVVQESRSKRAAQVGDAPIDYFTNGRTPGNPDASIKALKHIYHLLSIYKNMHAGAYPPDAFGFFSDISGNLPRYGFKNDEEVFRLLCNPDYRYADMVYNQPPSSHPITYYISNRRHDGSPVGSVKPADRRDVVAYTDIYVHQNVQTRNGKESESPVGFYLVLWDDGQVTKVPYDKVLLVPTGNSEFVSAFAGQAGVPGNAVSYDQFYQSMGAKEGPRGPAPGAASSSGRS